MPRRKQLPTPPPSTKIRQQSVARRFWLDRKEDESGVSGTGIVAEGVVFTSGWCAMSWLTGITQIGIYPSLDHVRMIHGHDGKTEILWENDTLPLPPMGSEDIIASNEGSGGGEEVS